MSIAEIRQRIVEEDGQMYSRAEVEAMLDEIEGEMEIIKLDINERIGVLRPDENKLQKVINKFKRMSKANTLEELKETCAEIDLFAYGGYLVGKRQQILELMEAN